MTLDSDLANEKFHNRGVSLTMSEWPEKGKMRRRWTFQRMGHEEDALKIDDICEGRVVTTAGCENASCKRRESRKKSLKKSEKRGKKPADTVMVEPEPEDVSSPLSGPADMISAKERASSSRLPAIKMKRSPLATRNKQARIEEEERREFREESKKEKAKKRETNSCTSQPSPTTPQQQKDKNERNRSQGRLKVTKKPGSVKSTQTESLKTRKTKKVCQAPCQKGEASVRGGCHLEDKMNRLTQMVESLIDKVDNLQKTLSDEQRIRAVQKDPKLAELLARAGKAADHLHAHYSDLVFLDKFPREKKDELKKLINDLRRLNGSR